MKWQQTKFEGVRFREHPTRKHGIGPDRYYAIRYRVEGVRREEGLGWASQGMTVQKAAAQLVKLQEANRTGEGPRTLSEKREARAEAEQQKREEKAAREREALSFGQVFTGSYYPAQADTSKSPKSILREEILFRLWLNPAIGGTPLNMVAAIHFERIRKNMRDAGRAPRTVQYAFAVVRQVFNFAMNRELYSGKNPAIRMARLKVDNGRHRFLSHEEADRLLAVLRVKSPDVHDMALVSLHCGLRAGEIFGLTWADVDLKGKRLTLRNTKSGRNRFAILTGDARSVLAKRSNGKGSELVFPARGGGKITAISNTFERVAEEVGLNTGGEDRGQRVVFHTLRHTFASWLVAAGVDLYTVKTLLGHSTITMTERYSHLAPDGLQLAARTLEASIKNGRTERAGRVVSLSDFKM